MSEITQGQVTIFQFDVKFRHEMSSVNGISEILSIELQGLCVFACYVFAYHNTVMKHLVMLTLLILIKMIKLNLLTMTCKLIFKYGD